MICTMTTIGERVTFARERLGITKAELASRAKLSRAAIGQIEKGDTKSPTPENCYRIADALGVETRWLVTGRGEFGGKKISGEDIHFIENSKVPVVNLKELRKSGAALRIPETSKFIPCPAEHGPRTFAARVESGAMSTPFGDRTYPEGSIIFVDPDRADIAPGDRVVARILSSGGYCFKVLQEEAGRQFLSSLNPAFPPISEPFEIIGKVIGKWEPE